MKLHFTKLEGCGNDYIYFNCFEQNIADPSLLSQKLSDRHFGIGGDGIILILPSEHADAMMRIFNADGSEAKMCGNGIRCVAKYVHDHGLSVNEPLRIDTLSGIKTIELQKDENDKVTSATVDMGAPVTEAEMIPVKLKNNELCDYMLTFNGRIYYLNPVSMGNPHCVIFTEDVDSMDISELGSYLEKGGLFPEGANTEFLEIIDDNNIKIRVWERGSAETYACGTGACAAAYIFRKKGYGSLTDEVNVHLKGGTLKIRYTGDTVLMNGPATEVFEGDIII
ncbi:MAG: diaminopimelate epimerase [Clostridia bacterium]|nr:diaminopimelate epimerase [Clostridia bacterium]